MKPLSGITITVADFCVGRFVYIDDELTIKQIDGRINHSLFEILGARVEFFTVDRQWWESWPFKDHIHSATFVPPGFESLATFKEAWQHEQHRRKLCALDNARLTVKRLEAELGNSSCQD